jgi:hypothetical protein
MRRVWSVNILPERNDVETRLDPLKKSEFVALKKRSIMDASGLTMARERANTHLSWTES